MAIGFPAAVAWLCALLLFAACAQAQAPVPVFQADLDAGCAAARDWRVSASLDPSARADRIRCVEAPDGGRALAITVKPGDAYERNPDSASTERAEIQLRQELIRFEATSWYSFRFRVGPSWLPRRNRTVIQQIKQNIDARYEKGRGGEEICDPANPLFKIELDSNGDTPVFRAKTAGTLGCGDSVGQSRFCGDWPVEAERWHRVNVMIRPSQNEGESRLRLWIDGRACPEQRGALGYPRYGVRKEGRPFIDAQPRFGIYRDALPDLAQTILYDEIAFWTQAPTGHPAWAGIDPAPAD